MRIISQDGMFDVPYENSSLNVISVKIDNVEYAGIYCYNSSVDRAIKMAKYSSEEKAKKAMRMLRKDYKRCVKCHYLMTFQFPAEEELE